MKYMPVKGYRVNRQDAFYSYFFCDGAKKNIPALF